MFEACGCIITSEQMKLWLTTFFPKLEPFYIDGDNNLLHQLESLGFQVYSKAQFVEIANQFVGEYGANYRHWSVSATASIVYLEADTLKDKWLQAKLFEHQVSLGRGQIFTFDWVRDISDDWLKRLKETHLACNDRIILTQGAWKLLPTEVKVKWILKWLEERVEPIAVLDVNCNNIPKRSEHVIKKHASTFPLASGANCFSAAAGSSLGSSEVIENWLNIEEFFDALKNEGLIKREEISRLTDSRRIRSHDVLVWENAEGSVIHAAYSVTDQILFNKMGQFWFQPWQYVNIDHVLDYAECLTNGGQIHIYRS
ncbi:hypothetical protein GQF01_29350 [Paenibacillus sp. 5J-6]|uniref:Uncharacterized protein n=2 Tax=Paenibacillus silvestris TaxID=2606219 RepID=A0A6L8V7M8_9BACL|nr:hypothetical protein [Paenibacillus silvestris]